ncbi:hypothetical protein FH968_02115 [Buttiauxella sp. B2]|uniref:RecE family exodeoxyribonuclease n=1 Tax=Buttiauxella sp. B2 TaxID=2587812 RepID=UPI00111D4D74|nr:RecE family exodeoxyribonuclease [Buttiauxella sp. B2]TNV22859.1 hypothetical protein FH968_02115 [Buttiauxella sp. B2]
MEVFSYLIKAKKTSGKKHLFIWIEAKNELAAERKVMVILDDADIETGKGGDYFSPTRTEYCAFDDMPLAEVLDDTWCDRYQLGEDNITWNLLQPSVSGECSTAVETVKESSPPVLKTVATLSFRHRVLAHYISTGYQYHVDQQQLTAIVALEMDTDNKFTQNLMLACENTNELKDYSDFNLFTIIDSVKTIFPSDKPAPPFNDMLTFMKKYASTEHIDRSLMMQAWIKGNRDFKSEQKLTSPDAKGLNKTDRGTGFTMTHDILALEVALGLLGRTMDFDIYNLPGSIVNRAREIINTKEKPFPQWQDAWRNVPECLQYSRASVIQSVKCAPEGLPLAPGKLMHYLNKTLTETDHEHPAAGIVAAACGIEQIQTASNDPALSTGTAVEELNAGPDKTATVIEMDQTGQSSAPADKKQVNGNQKEPKSGNVIPVFPTSTPVTVNMATLSYQQQLTIAALKGLCANPACIGTFDDIAAMAMTLAKSIGKVEASV